jgi:hypothetical protein
MIKKIIFPLLVLVSLTGCWDDDKTATATSGDANTTETIDGHVLPPEPDPAVNNSTLLGVDVNDNGVRDDVERWIYKTYDHPIERAIFMQTARAYQIVIADPSKAKENVHVMHDSVDCESYWSMRAKREGEVFWIERYKDLENEIKPIQFNTAERFSSYEQYNHNLSGGVYSSSEPEEWKSKCDFNATQLLEGH